MKLIVGLGNPGRAYRGTRHNVGFMVIEQLARKHQIGLSRRRLQARCGEGKIGIERAVLIKPQTYMNQSGLSVRGFLDAYGCSQEDLIVIHDDIDMELGRIRIRERGGHGGHRGVQSIIQAARGSDFIRLRIGIGRSRGAGDVRAHVLSRFEREERACVEEILSRAVEGVETIVCDGVERAMNRFNVAVTCEKKNM